MLDLIQLTKLTEDLEKAVLEKDFDEAQKLCMENNDFIFSIKAEKEESVNKKLKQFIKAHQSAVQLVQNTHTIMQDQLFKSINARKNLSKYKGVKNAK